MSKPEIGAGDVPITIDGQEYVLKPTLRAAQELCRNEGITMLLTRCANLEMETLRRVIAAGLGRSSRDLEEKLFKTGLRNVSGPCVDFLVNLSNGGMPVKKEDQEPPLEESR